MGVESFLKRHEDKLSRTSLLGKICLTASLLPLFVLTALFKIGAIAITYVWDETACVIFLLLSIGIPSLLLLVLKAYLPLTDLTVASISQGTNAQNLILHLWPHRHLSKKIRFAMEVFDFLLKAFFLAWVIANPEEGSGFEFSTRFELPSSVYKEWALETSICVLAIGPLALLLNIGQIHFQDEYVAKVVSRFPDQDPTKESDPDVGNKEGKDDTDVGLDHPGFKGDSREESSGDEVGEGDEERAESSVDGIVG